MDCDFSPSSPHLLPNGLFSPQNRISFELLALSGLLGFSTFKGGKMLLFQGFANSRIVREFPPFSFKVRIATLTRNQVVAQAARGFESHPIRHISGAKFALLRLFYVQISSIFAFGDFPFAFKTPALRQSKPCLHRLRRGYWGAVVEMGITADEGIAGGYVAFQLRS